MTSPIVGLALARCGADLQSFGGVVNLNNAALNRALNVTFQQIPNNCLVDDFTFDAETPNYAPGNILRGQQQHFNALHPGVDLKIQINQGWGPLNQVLNQDFQPIQHIVRNTAAPSPTCCDWMKNKFIWAWQSLTMAAMLKRSLTAGEDPYLISFGVKVHVIADQSAFDWLRLGLEQPDRNDPGALYRLESQAYDALAGLGYDLAPQNFGKKGA